MPEILEQLQEESIQERARGDNGTGGEYGSIGYSMLNWFTPAGETLPPWWSTRRDRELRDAAMMNDHYAGAENMITTKIAAIPWRIEPRDMSVKAHHKQAEEYSIRLWEGSEFGEGYDAWITKTLPDYFHQDNGFFSEVIGDGKKDGPIEGPALGVAALDASLCQRTGDPQFPVIYRDTGGGVYKLHRSRVIYRASMASSRANMHGVGFCWLSRAINNVQHLADIATYEQEKLGSRPTRAFLLTGGGLDPMDVQSAVTLTNDSIDGQGLARYSKMVAMGKAALPAPTLELIDLMSVPDGFDKQTSTTLAMYAIALAGGFPPRWIWPATASGATKADAMFSHMAGQGAGVGSILMMLTLLLGGSPTGARHMIGKFLPPHLKIVYDFQDDEQDRVSADVRASRAKQRETDLNTGVYDVRTARERAMSAGDLTEQQFAREELSDGRLPDGGDVLQLFSSTDDVFIRLLDLDTDEPLALDANDPVKMLVAIEVAALNAQDELQTSSNAKRRSQAEQAIAALGKLKGLYSDIINQQLQAEVVEGLAGGGAQTEPQDQPAAEDEQATETPEEGAPGEEPESDEMDEETEEKAFDFGVTGGGVISGNLGRDAVGRFVNVNQVRSGMNSRLRALLSKLRGEGGERLGAAEQKRLANRQAAAEKLGDSLPGGTATLDGLSTIRSGDAPENADALVSRGLAERNADGSVSMTSRGRSLLSAANSGDVDRARKALQPKPAKRAAGGKKKKTPEEIEAEKAQERAENRAGVAEQLPDDLAVADFGALNVFAEGGELDAASAQRLAQSGLVEFDTDGNARLTSSGRSASRASGRGDARETLDAISRGRDRAQAAQDKADERNARADELDDDADQAQSDLDQFEREQQEAIAALQERAVQARREGRFDQEAEDEAQSQIERLQADLERRQAGIDRTRARAEEQRARAAEMEARLGGTQVKALVFKQEPEEEPPSRNDLEDRLEDAIRPVLRKNRREVQRAIGRGQEPDTEKMRDQLVDALVPILIEAALLALAYYEDQFQLFLSDEDTLQQVTQWASQHAEQQADLMMRTTDNLINDAQAIEDDPARAREIANQAFTDERAERIGITEVTMGLAAGALLFQAVARSRHNVEIELFWFTQEDERVCPVCAPLHMTTQEEWGQQFPGGPPAHTRCRCGVIARRKR